jgi:hypothetical protein
VSATNSLVGGKAGDRVGWADNYFGSGGVTALSNGNYVVRSRFWDNGAVVDAGSVTWCTVTTGCTGEITAVNSVRGAAAGGGTGLNFAYDSVNDLLAVGRPADNIVTLFRRYRIFMPVAFRN